MLRSKIRVGSLAGMIAVASIAMLPVAPAIAEELPTNQDVDRADWTLLAAPFSASTTFQDALDLADKYSAAPVVGVRFENDQIVGEYFLGSDKSPEVFLEEFEARYGTVPQVAALVVEEPKRSAADAARYAPLAVIETGRPGFTASSIPEDKKAELFSSSVDPEPSTARAFPDWEPQNVYPSTIRNGTSQEFFHLVEWGPQTSPADIPGSFGVEIGIDLYNGATGTRGSVIPGDICGPDFRDQFIAKNYDWNAWTVSSWDGDLAASYPYADINDLFDSCGRNAMTIGFASPQNLPAGSGPFGLALNTWIDAKIGVTTSSGIGGGVQLVNSASCPFDGSIAFTDCMGVPTTTPPGVASNRPTLSTARNWVAATNKCWGSGEYGNATPIENPC